MIREMEKHFREELEDARAAQDGDRTAIAVRQLAMYRMLPVREHPDGEPIVPPALVEVETRGVTSWLLLVPGGGGLVTRVGTWAIQVVTPQSPLGERLLGRKHGDEIKIEVRNETRVYRVLSVS